MIRSRSRPPPRGPLRISGETRAATPSKNAQQACSSVILRSSSASPIGPCSVDEGEKEMPQKSVEPVPTRSSTTSRGPAASNSRAIPASIGDRPVALPIGLERLEGELGGLRAAAPPRPVEAEGHRPLVLGPAFDDRADGHALSIPWAMVSSRQDVDGPMTVRALMRQPTGFLPLAMSVGALAMIVWFVAIHGVVHQPDEGAQAHLWQLLVAGQLPLSAYFAIRWLPRASRPALVVLALQVAAVLLLAVAPLWALGGL